MNVKRVVTWSLVLIAAAAGTYEIIRRVRIYKEAAKIKAKMATETDTQPPATKLSADNDNFPLKKGSKGQRVLDIQQKLGVQPQSSYFGDLTEAIIKIKYNATTVDEALYTKIMNTKERVGAGTVVYDLTVLTPTSVVVTRDAPTTTGKAVNSYKYGQTIGTVTKALYDAAPAGSYLGLMGSAKQYVIKSDTIVFKQRVL